MENRFDSLAKSVSSAMSRRDAFWRLGAGLAASILASVGLKAARDGTCPRCCVTQCRNAHDGGGPGMGACMTQCLETGQLVDQDGDVISSGCQLVCP